MLFAKPLFGSDISPACAYCAHSRGGQEPDTFFCPKRGVVSGNYHCRSFSYDPLRRVPKRRPKLPTFRPEDFEL